MNDNNQNENPETNHDKYQDLRELAAFDAIGALTEHERRDFDLIEETADDEAQNEIRLARDAVMKQIREDLPNVQPSPALKHRVLATILRFIENDLGKAVQPRDKGQSDVSLGSFNWFERFFAGRVGVGWRVAALAFLTICIALFWMFVETKKWNDDLRGFARASDISEFERLIGPRTINYFIDRDAKHIVLAPVDDSESFKAMISYFPDRDDALFLARDLPPLSDEMYYVRVQAPGVDEVVVSFSSSGDIVGLDFKLPEDVDPATLSWWVMRFDEQGEPIKVMQGLS